MLKYYLDKTGKVIKSILFPSSEFVDTEPRKGSMNPVTSGGVAEAVEEGAGAAASNLAPEYSATSTYPAGSYVIHDGVLYTNPNAIGTAEAWNPAHWTQTTVAEMMAGGGGGGYKDVNLPPIISAPYNIPVGNREVVTVSYIGASSSDEIQLQLADDCTDAVVYFANKSPKDIAFNKLTITRQDTPNLKLFGTNYLYDVNINIEELPENIVSNVGGGSGYESPTDWSEIEVSSAIKSLNYDIEYSTDSTDTGFLIEIKGNVAILHIH